MMLDTMAAVLLVLGYAKIEVKVKTLLSRDWFMWHMSLLLLLFRAGTASDVTAFQ